MGKGYRIEYEGSDRYRDRRPRLQRVKVWLSLLLVGIALAVSLVFPQGKEKLRAMLIPGNDAVTVGALEELSMSVRSGENAKEALAAFCHTVMANGE